MNLRLLSTLAALASLLPLTSTAQPTATPEGWVWMGQYPWIWSSGKDTWFYVDQGPMPAWNLKTSERVPFAKDFVMVPVTDPGVRLQLGLPRPGSNATLTLWSDPEWIEIINNPLADIAVPEGYWKFEGHAWDGRYYVMAPPYEAPVKLEAAYKTDLAANTVHMTLRTDAGQVYSITLKYTDSDRGTYTLIYADVWQPRYEIITQWTPFQSIVEGQFRLSPIPGD